MVVNDRTRGCLRRYHSDDVIGLDAFRFSLSSASYVFLTPRSIVDKTVLPASTVLLIPVVTCFPSDGFFFRGAAWPRGGAAAGASATSAMVGGLRSTGDCGASVLSEPQAPRPQVNPHSGASPASSLPAGLSRFSIVPGGVRRRVDPRGAAPTP